MKFLKEKFRIRIGSFILFVYLILLKLLQKLINVIESVNKINLLNLNDESNNLYNLIIKSLIKKLRKFYENYNHNHEQFLVQLAYYQMFGLCFECNRINTYLNWCKECYSKRFQQNFDNWTSGNKQIDKFIQESQLNARGWFELLEWIPYYRLRNIKFLARGGFSTVYKAIWLDDRISRWDLYEKQDWERNVRKLDEQDYKDANNSQIKIPLKINEKYGRPIVLKSLNDSSNINEDFLNEWKLHLQCQHEAFLNYAVLIPIIGITQDPDTLNYMIVMDYAFNGSLRDNLLMKKYNPNDKFNNLFDISKQLKAIHKLNLVHGDFHNGNILQSKSSLFISDLGLCRPVNQPMTKDEIYGVLPYIAPEVLRGKPYTKAADIYSFGIIMWEMTSGVPAFHDIPHDLNLSLNICRGIRPEIIKGTMPEYIELMKRCWDNDPKKRPTSSELEVIFCKWLLEYPIEQDDEKRIPVPENEPEIVYHPKSCYTSRKFNYVAKLNEILLQDELSNKIVIMDDENYNHDGISKNLDELNELDDFMIKD